MTAISIIVPTRDRAHVLESSLASIAAQRSGDPFEVIVVDNASSDGTAELLAAWCGRDGRFRSLREERLGRSSAMNAGIAAAEGSLLLFTDDDVELAPGWVESFRRFFAAREGAPAIAGGAIVPAPPDLASWPEWLSESALVDAPGLDHGPRERVLAAHEFIWGASMAAPASVFGRFGGWDESVGRRGDHRGTYEDTEFQRRLRGAGGEVWYVPSARLRHRVPLEEVTPRRILDRAYRNGRNAAWFEPTSVARGLGATGVAFGRWLLATISFRFRAGSGHYDAARLAAREAGRTGESTAAGRRRARGTIQRVTWLASRVIVRMAQD